MKVKLIKTHGGLAMIILDFNGKDFFIKAEGTLAKIRNVGYEESVYNQVYISKLFHLLDVPVPKIKAIKIETAIKKMNEVLKQSSVSQIRQVKTFIRRLDTLRFNGVELAVVSNVIDGKEYRPMQGGVQTIRSGVAPGTDIDTMDLTYNAIYEAGKILCGEYLVRLTDRNTWNYMKKYIKSKKKLKIKHLWSIDLEQSAHSSRYAIEQSDLYNNVLKAILDTKTPNDDVEFIRGVHRVQLKINKILNNGDLEALNQKFDGKVKNSLLDGVINRGRKMVDIGAVTLAFKFEKMGNLNVSPDYLFWSYM